MNEKRKQPTYSRPASLNELERKRQIDRVNFENKLMIERLSHTRGVINNEDLKESFKKHQKAEQNLRRRQMKPLSLPKDFNPNSSFQRESKLNPSQSISTGFDASSYITQRYDSSSQDNVKIIEPSPIRTVADFRKQVISTKKIQHHPAKRSPGFIDSRSSEEHKRERKRNSDEGVYEITHVPY